MKDPKVLGGEPKRLSHGVMDPAALARFWADQEATVDEWIAYLEQSPTPTQVVDLLMSGSAAVPSSTR